MARPRLPIGENASRRAVKALARWRGWLTHHTGNGQHPPAGCPALGLVRPPRLVFAELKVGRNRPTPAQQEWLRQLGACPQAEVYLWTPDCWQEIERVLRRER